MEKCELCKVQDEIMKYSEGPWNKYGKACLVSDSFDSEPVKVCLCNIHISRTRADGYTVQVQEGRN